jgi:hypothetical protein
VPTMHRPSNLGRRADNLQFNDLERAAAV